MKRLPTRTSGICCISALAFGASFHGVESFNHPHVLTSTLTRRSPVSVIADARCANDINCITSNQKRRSQLPTRSAATHLFSTINGNNFSDLTEDKDDSATRHFLENQLFFLAPFFAAFASFFLYPTASRSFHSIAVLLSNNKWVPVDGGQLQWSVLLPALNGVVMTCVSLLYANLISTTGTQLRNRQIKIQESLTTEIDGIRGLTQLLPFYPEGEVGAQSLCGSQLMVYIKLLTLELSPDSDPLSLRSASPPLSSYREKLHSTSILDGALHDNIRERSYEMLDRVGTGRSSRIAALQNTFPPLHYVTITALTAAILFVFLIETDRPVILFLDNFQLRLIWSLLVGTLTAIYCIGIDLSSPFVGTYVVAADQLLDEAEDLLTLIRDTSTKSVPEVNGGTDDVNGAVTYSTPSAIAPQQSEAQQTNTASIETSPAVPAENRDYTGGSVQKTSFDGGTHSLSGPPPAADEDDLGEPMTQATSYEEYMRRRQQGEY